MDTKQCLKCKEIKELNEFYNDKNRKKDRHFPYCKKCSNNRVKDWTNNNPEKNKIIKNRYIKNNPEKERERNKKYRQEHREKIKEIKKKWKTNNLERYKKQCRDYNNKNKEKRRLFYLQYKEEIIECGKKRYQEHKETIRKTQNIYQNKKRKTDIRFRLRDNVSSLIRIKLNRRLSNKNGKRTWKFLPYSVDNLIKHLESLFEPWMNWNNYGFGAGKWTIDHKKAESLFKYTSVEDPEFKKCWALENLQPMEYIANIKKGKKLIY